MASIFRGFGVATAFLIAALLVGVVNPAALAQLYEQPTLIIDPGMHTAPIIDVGVDAASQIAVSGADDKTVRVWSLADGKLLRTIRAPSGPGEIGKFRAVAVRPGGALVAAGGWTQLTASAPEESIYLFETETGKMAARITGPPSTVHGLAFSPDGRYLAVGFYSSGLRVYDGQREWSEVFRDTDYGDLIYGITFSGDGRLAAASYDGKVRLYDRAFKLVVPPQKVIGGERPTRIAFSPDGASLAVGLSDAPIVVLLDGHSLGLLPGPNLADLNNGSLDAVAWSKDGNTLYAGGRYWDRNTAPVLAWANAGRGARRVLPAAISMITRLAPLPDGGLVVGTQDPFLGVLEPDGRPRWTHSTPEADFRSQGNKLAVSAEGTIVDFGFELWGKSPLRIDLRALKLSRNPPVDQRAIPAKQTGLVIEKWLDDTPTLDGKPIQLNQRELSRSLAIAPDNSRFVLGCDWSLRALDAKGQLIWRRATPSTVWAVNISSDNRLADHGLRRRDDSLAPPR